MLSRRLSNSSDRSAVPQYITCVQTHSLAPHEHYRNDFGTAQKQAVAAASFAFERAHERALAAQGLKEGDIDQAADIDEQVAMGQDLGRKQSIRFTGSTAVPIRRRSITQRLAPENNKVFSMPDGAQTGSRTTGSYFSHGIWDARNSQESNVSSSSALLRKPKRAKSMFTLRGSATSLFGDNGAFNNSRVQQNLASSKKEHSQPTAKSGIHLRRSFTFLRWEKDQMTPGLDMLKYHGAAAQLAREQYLQELEEKGVSPAPSQNHKSQKAFRKSVRSKSINSYLGAIASPPQAPTEFSLQKRLGHKARSLSFSIKRKLKHVFQRSSDANDTIPAQQLHSSRPHFGEYLSKYSGASQDNYEIPLSDSAILRNVRSRESSLGKAPDFLESVSPTGKIRNIRDEDGTNHLLAGWVSPMSGHSSAATQSREKKRLSVIQEHGGPHHSSLSDHNYADIGKVFFAPLRNNSVGQQVENSPDIQIRSVLPQNINDNRALAQITGYHREKEDVDDDMAASPFNPQGASQSTHSLKSMPVDGLSPHQGAKPSNLVIVKPVRLSNTDNDIHSSQNRSSDYSVQEKFLEMYTRLKPERTAGWDETKDPSPKQPLREIKSAISPSSMHIERTNTSPFRRLMGFGSDNETVADSKIEEYAPIRSRTESTSGSASIYSRTSDGNTPKDNKSSASLAQSEPSHGRGKSVVIKTLHNSPMESLGPPRGWREISSQSKGRQNWMEPRVFKEENRRLEDYQDLSATNKENRPKRESTQIDNDNTYMKQKDFRIPLKYATPQPTQRHHASRSVFRRSPLLEIGQSPTPDRSDQSSSISPRQSSTPHGFLYQGLATSSLGQNKQGSGLRPTGLDVTQNLQGRNLLGTLNGCTLRHGISVSTESIRTDPTIDMRGTRKPAPIRAVFRTTKATKSQGYSSSERLARVGRLQSSNSPASHNSGQIGSVTENNGNGQNDGEVIGATFKGALEIGGVLDQNVFSTSCNEAQISGLGRVVDSFSSSRRNQEVNEDHRTGLAFL